MQKQEEELKKLRRQENDKEEVIQTRITQALSEQQLKFQELQKNKAQEEAEDAFQSFLDQLELQENEERIIIDGESRVWKIIRCSRSILQEEEEEETEEETEQQDSPEQ